MFTIVEKVKEEDLYTDSSYGDGYYLQFIMRALPGSYAVQKELIPRDPRMKCLSNVKKALLERESNIAEERVANKERQVLHKAAAFVAGEGVSSAGASPSAITCYSCGELGHKSINCPKKNGRAPWRGNSSHRGRGGSHRSYTDRKQYNPRYVANKGTVRHWPSQQNHNHNHHHMAAPAAAHRHAQPTHVQQPNRGAHNHRGRGAPGRKPHNNHH